MGHPKCANQQPVFANRKPSDFTRRLVWDDICIRSLLPAHWKETFRMNKRLNLLLSVLVGLVLAFIAMSMIDIATSPRQPAPYTFEVNDRVWYIPGDRPAVVYRVNSGASWDDLRYQIEFAIGGQMEMRWVNEGSVDPLTNQVPILNHRYEQ